MKANILYLLKRFIRITLAFLLVLLLLRTAETFYLKSVHIFPAMIWIAEFRGFFIDLLLLLLVALILVTPYLLLSFLHPKAGLFFYIFIFILLILINTALTGYFSVTLVPLDHVVFTYSLKEMWLIALSSVHWNLFYLLLPIGIILLVLFSIFLFRNLPIPKVVIAVFFVASFGSAFLFHTLTPKQSHYEKEIEYYLLTNKFYYFFDNCFRNYHYFKNPGNLDASVSKAASRWQEAQHGFHFYGIQYPFLHSDNATDVLGEFFQFKEQKPNIVVIIVESLSSVFCGENPTYGSFTPFLDSLIGKSLYWKNFIATSERTFNVLPALFGSLPPGKGNIFTDLSKCPFQFSMIRYLKEDGYYTSFFYGGDPAFNDMENYCKRQNVDYILRFFDPAYQRMVMDNPGFTWGYSDGDLFKRSFEVIDSLKKTPRLDIYLTLTMHSPFMPPQADLYRKKVRERMVELGFSKERIQVSLTYENICSAILYSDNALRFFFKEYSKRNEFDNTIFVITGDHALPELNISYISNLERFHVPMIIYSPMLRKSVHFKSVSSHLDVTPSLLAMMKKQFNTNLLPEAHWLGTGIDTCRSFRNTHSFAMIRNNRDIIDYIKGNYYLCGDRLYDIVPDLLIRENGDDTLLKQMVQELGDFKTLNSHVIQQNKLLPMELFYPEGLKQKLLTNAEDLPLELADSISEFHTILKNINLDSNFKYMDIELDFSFKTREKDVKKFPVISFVVLDSSEKLQVWHSVSFSEKSDSQLKPGFWNHVTIRKSLDLSLCPDVRGKHVNMYFWNWNRGIVHYKDAKIKITGHY